ncbi:RNA polymerase sigma-70 factor [Bacillus oleivorans]|uniref:RNA polymerase sigma-70 factor n=1 Tax=Bacillus oleivorans TaxID=1448271 RepID=A0A285D4V5_9BACI|nr:sigma-70 family RNA polymerase sigma factor [Bacillus oleivorans]SNX74830.1 RNA polymerase sigma-70 factor [Bacillus oleivorans]
MKDFRELYKLYSKQLYNYLFYLTNDRSLAEELVQETFFQAFKSIHRFKGKSTIKTWLYQIGKNVYYKYLKNNTINNDQFDENDVKFADFSTPENIWVKEEQERMLHLAIQQLKEPYKQVVILRSFNELSFKEIGIIFEESENWARVNFHRGKQKIREILK